ncbi:DUF1707 domain-containing protein [Saccharothrix sp.]|uniref:DUF1707 SHOCT-like domain-containing protein n=1 Tax=Saccharothrix sp. TaxID=1873460 RepID=UPI00281174F6|nr:DUF1707 domain-containing protein [Saccharothrix sp.]
MTESHFRAADDDRAAVAERLAKAHEEGRLTRAEFEERSLAVREARTYAELRELTADLPGDEPVGADGGRRAPGSRDTPAAGGQAGRPAPVWQDASSMAARPDRAGDAAGAGPASTGQGGVGTGFTHAGDAAGAGSTSTGQDGVGAAAGYARAGDAAGGRPDPVWRDAPSGPGARIGPDAHRDPGNGYGGAGHEAQARRSESSPVRAKRSKTAVFLAVLTVLWLFAGAINLLIWAIVNGTSETSVYPWWLWVVGPLGVVVVTAHLVRFGLRR